MSEYKEKIEQYSGFEVRHPRFKSPDSSGHFNKQIKAIVALHTGIGNGIYAGSALVDQIIECDQRTFGHIAILAQSPFQRELFLNDDRIDRVITVDPALFSFDKLLTRLFYRDRAIKNLASYIYEQSFDFAFAGNLDYVFFRQLGIPVVGISPLDLMRDYWDIQHSINAPVSRRMREMIDNYLSVSKPEIDNFITPLYVNSEDIKKARQIVVEGKSKSKITDAIMIGVAPDTTSCVTRPPTELFSKIIINGVSSIKNKVVFNIFAGLSEPSASTDLAKVLQSHFPPKQIVMIPLLKILETTALAHEMKVFFVGDTGLMHLAACEQVLNEKDDQTLQPLNDTKIIALFGGTNGRFYNSNPENITAIGQDSLIQKKLFPGFCKVGYRPKEPTGGHNIYFDHTKPEDGILAVQMVLGLI